MLAAAVPFLPCQGHEHAVSLRRPCFGYDGCCVLFQSSMEELGRALHSAAGKFLQCCTGSSPSMSSVRQGEADAHLGTSASLAGVLGSQLYTLWFLSSFLSLFRINTSCAPIELSYSTATVLPPGAAPGQLGPAGRGWRLPLHWHQDCWPKYSPGLSQISATMDQPLRIHPVPAPGPASACCCPGTALLARGLLALLPWSAQAAAPAPCPVLPA